MKPYVEPTNRTEDVDAKTSKRLVGPKSPGITKTMFRASRYGPPAYRMDFVEYVRRNKRPNEPAHVYMTVRSCAIRQMLRDNHSGGRPPTDATNRAQCVVLHQAIGPHLTYSRRAYASIPAILQDVQDGIVVSIADGLSRDVGNVAHKDCNDEDVVQVYVDAIYERLLHRFKDAGVSWSSKPKAEQVIAVAKVYRDKPPNTLDMQGATAICHVITHMFFVECPSLFKHEISEIDYEQLPVAVRARCHPNSRLARIAARCPEIDTICEVFVCINDE